MRAPWNSHPIGPAPAPEGWEAMRRPGRHSDESLTGTTRQWLRRLPAGRRPLRLCELFPRVANQIAWCWRDPAEAREVLESLLIDQRGGRQGFPKPVALELRRLREYLDRSADDLPGQARWSLLRQFWAGH